MNTLVINQNTIHFEICLFTRGLVLEFDESVLQTVSCTLVSYDFAGENCAKTGEYCLKILIYRLLAKYFRMEESRN